MYGKAVLVIATTVIILLMLFGNAKVRVFSVLVNQIKVFKNAKTEKLSWWDIVCFIIMPICLAIILTIGFRCIIDDDLASVLTTVFAFVFTVLFGFAAILVGKMESNNDIERTSLSNASEDNTSAEEINKKTRTPFYPKEWKDSFGLPVEEHRKALEINMLKGYAEFTTPK